MPPLLIGMIIVGFGTSAPEILVSSSVALQGSPGIALGNAFGSNIVTISFNLGLSALVIPISFRSLVLFKELPILVVVTGLCAWLLWDQTFSRAEAMASLAVFGPDILESVEVLGLDNFSDSAIVIKARTKTKPIKQWAVGCEFNRRLTARFDELGIEIPFPHRTINFGVDKSGEAPAMRLQKEQTTGGES